MTSVIGLSRGLSCVISLCFVKVIIGKIFRTIPSAKAVPMAAGQPLARAITPDPKLAAELGRHFAVSQNSALT